MSIKQNMDSLVQRRPEEPLYLYIRKSIRERISRGVYTPGSLIPSENELAEEFATTRLTVRNALDELVEQGLIRRVKGKGMFVMAPWSQHHSHSRGFREQAAAKQAQASVRMLKSSCRLAGPYYARILDIAEDDLLYSIRRLNILDQEPVSIERTFIPLKLFEGIENIDISVFSLYETYRLYGHQIETALEKIDIVALSTRDAGLLQVDPGTLTFEIECISYDGEGRAIEYASSYNRCDSGIYTYSY